MWVFGHSPDDLRRQLTFNFDILHRRSSDSRCTCIVWISLLLEAMSIVLTIVKWEGAFFDYLRSGLCGSSFSFRCFSYIWKLVGVRFEEFFRLAREARCMDHFRLRGHRWWNRGLRFRDCRVVDTWLSDLDLGPLMTVFSLIELSIRRLLPFLIIFIITIFTIFRTWERSLNFWFECTCTTRLSLAIEV